MSDEELTPAAPPPLPQRRDVALPSAVESKLAVAVLPVVRATLRTVKALEGRLQSLEQQLAARAAQRTDQGATAASLAN